MENPLLTIFSDFVSLFFPRYCLACEGALLKGEDMVCTGCMLEMPQTHYHLDPDNPLKDRISARIPVTDVVALYKFTKSGRIQHLLHGLKYKNHPEIGVMLGKIYGQKLLEAGMTHWDLILPVPLHPVRLRRRGYNQSSMFAKGLSEQLKISYCDNTLIRRIKTETQTRKSKISRWKNVSEVFEVNNKPMVRDKSILLVDDVITTGATLEACGNVILEAGCKTLSIACIAEA